MKAPKEEALAAAPPVVTEEELLCLLAALVRRLRLLAPGGEEPGVRPGEDTHEAGPSQEGA